MNDDEQGLCEFCKIHLANIRTNLSRYACWDCFHLARAMAGGKYDHRGAPDDWLTMADLTRKTGINLPISPLSLKVLRNKGFVISSMPTTTTNKTRHFVTARSVQGYLKRNILHRTKNDAQLVD